MWAIHREGGRSAFGDKSVCVYIQGAPRACRLTLSPAHMIREGVKGLRDGKMVRRHYHSSQLLSWVEGSNDNAKGWKR